MRSVMRSAVNTEVQQLRRFLEAGAGRTAVLTGAGISTDSGIPDYRGPNGVYKRNAEFRPIQFQEVRAVCLCCSIAAVWFN